MHTNWRSKFNPALFALVALTFLVSCTDTRKAVYFNTLDQGAIRANTPLPQSVIQKNDLLGISISSPNPDASALFNPPGASTGLLVDEQGNIQVPLLGYIKAAGLTKEQLKTTLTNQLLDKKLLVDPVVAIRFLNFRVTVLGAVGGPQVVQVPSEKITLLEALGSAGDIALTGRKDNVLIIREENGVTNAVRINLNTTEIFNSPYYYLRANDIVYVEPIKVRINRESGNMDRWMPFVLGGLGLLTSLLFIFTSGN